MKEGFALGCASAVCLSGKSILAFEMSHPAVFGFEVGAARAENERTRESKIVPHIFSIKKSVLLNALDRVSYKHTTYPDKVCTEPDDSEGMDNTRECI